MKQLGFFDLPEHLKLLSEAGDPLEEMGRVIDFECVSASFGGSILLWGRRQGWAAAL